MSVAVIDRNNVVLRGRMSAPAELRTLPSGDTLVTFRLVVRRAEPRVRGQSVDVLTCVTYDRSLQRRAAAWQPGDVVEVEVTGVGRLVNTVAEAPAPAYAIGHQPTDGDAITRVALGGDWWAARDAAKGVRTGRPA